MEGSFEDENEDSINLQEIFNDIHTFIESVERIEEEFRSLYQQVLKEVNSIKVANGQLPPKQAMQHFIRGLESALLEKDFATLKQVLHKLITEAKEIIRKQKSSIHNKSIEQSIQLSEKETADLLRNANTYSGKVEIKQLKDKVKYIEKTFKNVQENERALNLKEEECKVLSKSSEEKRRRIGATKRIT